MTKDYCDICKKETQYENSDRFMDMKERLESLIICNECYKKISDRNIVLSEIKEVSNG